MGLCDEICTVVFSVLSDAFDKRRCHCLPGLACLSFPLRTRNPRKLQQAMTSALPTGGSAFLKQMLVLDGVPFSFEYGG